MENDDHLEASGIDTGDNNASTLNDDTNNTAPEIDMDDTTGSDGGPSKDRVSGEPDETGDSSYSSGPTRSRSDTSRIGGMGISGGTGDSATSQSGGRSQY